MSRTVVDRLRLLSLFHSDPHENGSLAQPAVGPVSHSISVVGHHRSSHSLFQDLEKTTESGRQLFLSGDGYIKLYVLLLTHL